MVDVCAKCDRVPAFAELAVREAGTVYVHKSRGGLAGSELGAYRGGYI